MSKIRTVRDYKILKKGNNWYVLNKYDNATMAKVLCLYTSPEQKDCENWVRLKLAWFKKKR